VAERPVENAPCPHPITFIPNSAFSVPPHAFVAGYEWRWRVLSSRGVGAAVMTTADGPKLATAVTRADEASIAETTPATSLPPSPSYPSWPSCVSDTRTEGNCVSVKPRKPRMVWVANDRLAIAAVALGDQRTEFAVRSGTGTREKTDRPELRSQVVQPLNSHQPLHFAPRTPCDQIQASSGLSESCQNKAATYRNLRFLQWQSWCRRQANNTPN
jgi:hypothetical protein